MDEATAKSLGEKLGTLELTKDEATLLAVLLDGVPSNEEEVAGFMEPLDRPTSSLNFEEIKVTYAPVVVQHSHKGWIDVLSIDWG